MRRREFVGAAASIALATAAGSKVAAAVPGGISHGSEAAAAIADRLIGAFPSRKSLEAIGDAYCRSEAAAGALCRPCLQSEVEVLLQHLGLGEEDVRQMTPDGIRARIKAGTAADFTEGRIVRIEGWLLGEAEARLCMIAALCAA